MIRIQVLHEQIKNGIREAMIARDEVRLKTLRGMVAAFINEAMTKGKKPDEFLGDEETLAVIARLVKQRKDSIEQFKKGGRQDLVKEETEELVILDSYLPKMMDKSEILTVAKEKKDELKIDDPSKKGVLMSFVMKELRGKADGADVKAVVDSLFS